MDTSVIIIILILLCFAVTIFLSKKQENKLHKRIEILEDRHRHDTQTIRSELMNRMQGFHRESLEKELALFNNTNGLIKEIGNDSKLHYEIVKEFSKHSETRIVEIKNQINQLFEKIYRETIASLKHTQSLINDIESKIASQFQFAKDFSKKTESNSVEIKNKISLLINQMHEEIITYSKTTQSIISEIETKSNSQYKNIKEFQERSELLNSKNNDNFLVQINSMKKLLKEFEDIVGEVLVTNQNRDSLSEKYLKEFNQRSEDLKTTTELMYNDFDLLLELLKAGLMNDLIKDLKIKSLS